MNAIKITLNSAPTDIPTFMAIKNLSTLVKSCFNALLTVIKLIVKLLMIFSVIKLIVKLLMIF